MQVTKRSATTNATVMEVSGRLDAVTSPGLEKEIAAFFSGPARGLALDLGRVDYVSSAGLRVLLLAARKAKEGGVGFAVFGVQSQVVEVMKISGLESLLGVVPGEAEALAAVEHGAKE